jgi:hypothetical protein
LPRRSGADAVVTKKSVQLLERRQMIADETNLLGQPKKDVQGARDEVVELLREANENDELIFIEDAA